MEIFKSFIVKCQSILTLSNNFYKQNKMNQMKKGFPFQFGRERIPDNKKFNYISF